MATGDDMLRPQVDDPPTGLSLLAGDGRYLKYHDTGTVGNRAMTPAERSLRARMAAYRLHASHDPTKTTAAARATFLSRFEREVDPDGVLQPHERRRRAAAARKASFTNLAIKSANARRKTRPATEERP